MLPGHKTVRRLAERAVFAVGLLWTSPNTLLGLALGLAGCLGGARLHLSARHRAVVFLRFPWGPGGAITFGNVIVATGEDLDRCCQTYAHRAGRCIDPLMHLGDHERAHVYQYMLLGPFFLPVYVMLGGVSVNNPLEQAADRYALTGSGWWPWR